MSHPNPATFYRIGGAAGFGTAVILLINAAKRAEVIPTSALTQLVAPLAQILALAFVTALYLAFGRRAGTFGLVAFLLNAFSLAALVGVEFVINLVFAELPDDTIEALRAGPLGVALTVASITFLLGTLAFVTAMIRTRQIPVAPLVLYAVGAVPGFVPGLRPRGGPRPRTPHHGRRSRLARDLALQQRQPHHHLGRPHSHRHAADRGEPVMGRPLHAPTPTRLTHPQDQENKMKQHPQIDRVRGYSGDRHQRRARHPRRARAS